MRPLLALVTGLALAAAPAYAQKRGVIPAPPISLRGEIATDDGAPKGEAEAPANGPAAPAPLPALLAPLAVQRPDPGRCRLTCASNYYFCLSADSTDASCPDNWSQCRAACDAPGATERLGALRGG